MTEISIFHFEEPFSFNLSVMKTPKRLFIIDTYMGADTIGEVINYCNEVKKGKQLYIINTHSHFDHIWGNSAFKDSEIIAHNICYNIIKQDGQKILNEIKKENPQWIKGEIEIILPNLIFNDEIIFNDGDSKISIKYLPGHSEDSSVIMIEPEKILIAGDMVEDPFPLLEAENIEIYIKNLKYLEELNFTRVIPSHGKRQDSSLIKDNIYYIQRLKEHVIKLIEKKQSPDEEELGIDKIIKKNNIVSDFYLTSHKNNIKKTYDFYKNRHGS